MFKKIKSVLSTGPPTRWFATVAEAGFVVAARVEEMDYKQKEDYDHVVTLDFREPVRDNNDVSHLNLRGEGGNIGGQLDLLAGESSTDFTMNPKDGEVNVVAVTTDDSVRDTTTIRFYEEIIDAE